MPTKHVLKNRFTKGVEACDRMFEVRNVSVSERTVRRGGLEFRAFRPAQALEFLPLH